MAATSSEIISSSSYRVKFRRDEFLQLAMEAKPSRIFRVKNMHFFALDGFVVYSSECQDTDFAVRVIPAIEFSNEPWAKG